MDPEVVHTSNPHDFRCCLRDSGNRSLKTEQQARAHVSDCARLRVLTHPVIHPCMPLHPPKPSRQPPSSHHPPTTPPSTRACHPCAHAQTQVPGGGTGPCIHRRWHRNMPEAGFELLLLVSVYKGSFLILVSVDIGCPFGGTRHISPLPCAGTHKASFTIGPSNQEWHLGILGLWWWQEIRTAARQVVVVLVIFCPRPLAT